MTVKEFVDTMRVESTLKVLSGYNGKVVCRDFNKNKHIDIGEREIISVFADLLIKDIGFGKHAYPIICVYVNGYEEYKKDMMKQ